MRGEQQKASRRSKQGSACPTMPGPRQNCYASKANFCYCRADLRPQKRRIFWQALDGARRQEALSWELRAATSLARLVRNQGRPSDAMAVLQPVYDRFTEGFDTADLQASKRLIDALS